MSRTSSPWRLPDGGHEGRGCRKTGRYPDQVLAPETVPASVAILNMDETGAIASAAAMSIVILLTSAAVRLAHWLLVRGLVRRTQAWRTR